MEILLTGESSSIVSTWTEHLCIETTSRGVTLSSRGYEVLAEGSHYEVEREDGKVDWELPAEIDGK